MGTWCCKFALLAATLAAAAPAARAQATVAEQYLFSAINTERISAGLAPLQWNGSLNRAALLHAEQMRSAGRISHQFPGEDDLAARAAAAGTRFSRIAENVAMSGSPVQMHAALMQSQHHRENILDPNVTVIGISVVASRGQLWGVEDFARNVESLTLHQQEARVADLVMQAGVANVEPSDSARSTCGKAEGFSGARPAFVMRFTSTDLQQLPAQLKTRIGSGGISSAAVGACESQSKSDFAVYNIAVVLYR